MKQKYMIASSLCFLLFFSNACQTTTNEIEVQGAWARPGDQGSNSAVYFTLKNPIGEDSLNEVSSSIAEIVQIHRSILNDDGSMQMQHQEFVTLPEGSEVLFEPGGLHVMLMGLQKPLLEGDLFEIILHFRNSEVISIDVLVKGP